MLEALQFTTEIKGDAIKTLTQIQQMLEQLSGKTTITIAVDGLQDFQNFVKSDDFKNVAKNISSAFGGKKADNVTAFFKNLKDEIEGMKNALKSNDFSSFMQQIDQLTSKFNTLAQAYRNFLSGSGSKSGSNVITDMNRRLKEVEKAIEKLEPAFTKLQKKSEKLEQQQDKLAQKQKKLAENMKGTTKEAEKQSVSFNSLQNMMTKFLSVYAIGRVASEMAQITGELELQKRSLEVIVGNAGTANELYSTIRDMSQMSPYTFQNLMKSTRQLSAFGIETRDLYDTMKALSDIGAGLSVDVQRLILAYGHTRSYGYLSGIQNRQFETAGIDMIGGLVEYYNKLADAEERAGRAAERVTRKDVFKRMSKRDISFEDVNAVIMELDREGGKFYNMQERQFETLGGQLRNLRNNYNIMMSEMGEQNKGVLKFGVNLLNELTGNWEKYGTVIKALIPALLGLRFAMVAVNQANKNGVSLFTAEGWEQIKEGRKAIFTSFKNILTSTGTWIMAALTAFTAIYTHFHDMSKEAERVAKDMAESAERSAAEMDRILQNYNGGAITVTSKRETVNNKEVTSNEISFNREAMKALNLGYELEELKRKLQAISPFYEGDLVDIFKLQTQEEQFEAIIQRIESYRKANDIIAANEDNFAESSKGGFFKGMESLQENAKDYAKSIDLIGKRLKNMREEETLTVDMLNQFNKELKGVLGDGTIASKAENLRKFFVNTLAMSEEDRQKLFLSWSDGLKTVYADAFNMNEYAGYVLESGKRPGARLFGDVWRALFGSNAMPRQKDLEKNMENVAKELKDALEKSPGDYTTRIATIRTNFVASTQDSKLPEDVSRALFESLLQSVSDQLGNTDYTKYMETKFEEEFGKRIEAAVKNNPNWTREQASSEAFTIANDLHKEWENQGRDDSRFWNDGFREGLQESAKSFVSVKMAWQDAVQDAFPMGAIDKNGQPVVNWDYSNFYDQFSQRVRDAGQTMESAGVFFGDTMKKVHDDLAKEIEMEFKPAEKKWGITIEPDFRVETKNLDKLRQLKAAIDQELKNEQEKKGLSQDQEKIEGLTTLSGNLNQAIILEDMALQYGVEYSSKGKGSTSYKAEFEKRWDERIRVMKEAYDWYDKWEKSIGHDSALEKVNERYQDIFEQWRNDEKIPLDFDVNEIADYQKYIEKIRDAALDMYEKQKNDPNKNNGQEALRVYRQAVSLLTDINYDNFTKAAEKFSSIIKKTMDDLQARWELFNSVIEATHDEDLAYSVAGITGDEMNARTYAEALRMNLEDTIAESGLVGVELDLTLDEDGIREMLEKGIPDVKNADEYAKKVAGILNQYQQWQKVQRDLVKSDVQVFAKLIGSNKTYEKQINDINDSLYRELLSLERLREAGVISFEQQASASWMAQINADYEKAQLTSDYRNMFDNAVAMTKDDFKGIYDKLDELLDEMLQIGSLSPEEYVSKMQQLTQAKTTFNAGPKSAFGAFWEGGVEGRASFLRTRANKILDDYATGKATEEEKKNAEDAAENAEKLAESMKDLQTAVQNLQSAMGVLGDFFSAIGDEDMAQMLSSNGAIGSTLSGLSAGSAYGPWGAAIGAGLGLVSGIANMNHYWAQKSIEQNNLQIDRLKEINDNLGKIRERSFGYAKADDKTLGTFRSSIDKYRAAQGLLGSRYSKKTIEAMQRAIESESAYQAEFASLLAQRDKAQANLKTAEGDKKASKKEIEEYKKQVADLEEEITYFTQNLAKELWGIDVKGWADQINDALINAFENGENAAKAYQDAVRSIMQNVTSEIMKMGIIEPMMEKLQKILFGTKDKDGKWVGGAVSTDELLNDPVKAAKKMATESKKFFANEGNAMMTAAREFYEAMNAGMDGILTNPNANTLSSSIQGTSEETSNLLAGYVSALRQDVAADRILLEAYINQIWPQFIEETMRQGVIGPLGSIDRKVGYILQAMTGNENDGGGRGGMYEIISDIYDKLDGLTNGRYSIDVK